MLGFCLDRRPNRKLAIKNVLLLFRLSFPSECGFCLYYSVDYCY